MDDHPRRVGAPKPRRPSPERRCSVYRAAADAKFDDPLRAAPVESTQAQRAGSLKSLWDPLIARGCVDEEREEATIREAVHAMAIVGGAQAHV
jgi:hypothetical protein